MTTHTLSNGQEMKEEEKAVIEYRDLTIHQRISLKGIFSSKKERSFLNHRHDSKPFDMIYLLAITSTWEEAIDMFFSNP